MFRVRTVWSGLGGAPYLSTLYFLDTGGLTAQNAVNALGTFWTSIDTNLPTTLSWATEADVDNIDLSGVLVGTNVTTPATGSGNISASLTSTAVQALVRWSTGAFVNGREVRGRTFIPGMSNTTTNLGNGTPSAAFQTVLNNAAAALVADANSTPVVWARSAALSAAITGGAAWGQFAVLRSRRD